MYVRLITFHLREGVHKEDADPVYEEMFSLLQQQRGFQGLAGMINEESGQAVSLSFWNDQESAAEAGEQSLPLLMEDIQRLIDRPLEVSGYELVRRDIPSS